MTAIREPRAESYAERQARGLVAELAHLRELLEAYRDGASPPATASAPPRGDREPETALDQVVRVFGLSPFERRLLVLAAAVELDGGTAALVASVQRSPDPRPTFALALAAIPDAHWDALAPGSPLRYWRLLEPAAGPTLASRPLALDERVLHHVTGMATLDQRLDGVVEPDAGAVQLAPSQLHVAGELASTLPAAGTFDAVRLHGADAETRLAVAGALARLLGLRPLVVRAAALPPPGVELARMARLIEREAMLLDGLPVVDPEGGDAAAIDALLSLMRTPFAVLAGEHGGRVGGRAAMQRAIAAPSPAEQRALWATALGEPLGAPVATAVEEVSQHYRLAPPTVAAIAREARATAADAPHTAEALRRLARERSRRGLDDLAEHIEPKALWDDLVLPDGHAEMLREIERHVRHRTHVYERWGFAERTSRGLGIAALFAGESGTGKTLAAEVLAHELGVDLYRIDLAATVSKYIGETEKNLRRLFDAAEAGGAVLLFDEADALFGKRGEIRDGHDRYANLEVAYLLQRMEAYRGLAILTTNLRSNVDRAFVRRLRFVVQFPFPDAAQRAAIWRRAFPPATPLDGIVPERLAALTVTGGSIRSIALSAAFAAAEEGTAVTREHVLRGARIEYAKAERALTDAETAAI